MSDQAILVTGAAGFIGFHVARQLLAEGRNVVGLDNLNNYYDPALKKARLDILRKRSAFRVRADRSRRSRRQWQRLFAKHRFPGGGPSRGAGRRALFDRTSARLRRRQSRRLRQRAGGLPAQRLQTSSVASSSSVYGANTKLPFSVQDNVDHPISLYAAYEEGQRADGALLQPSLSASGDGLAVLYGLRPVGPSRHGDVHLCQGDRRGSADQAVQSWQHAPRFHLRRRCQRGDRPPHRSSAAGQSGLVRRPARSVEQRRAVEDLQHRQQQSRRAHRMWFHCWRRSSAAPPPRRCCRCSPATCRRPMPMSRISRATSDFGRRPRSKMVSHSLRNGIVTITDL